MTQCNIISDHPISRLNHYIQVHDLPRWTEEATKTGPDHCPTFAVVLKLLTHTSRAEGNSKAEARHKAAESLLVQLQSAGTARIDYFITQLATALDNDSLVTWVVRKTPDQVRVECRFGDQFLSGEGPTTEVALTTLLGIDAIRQRISRICSKLQSL